MKTFDNYHKGTFSPDGKLLALIEGSYVDIVEVSSGHRLSRLAPDKATMLGAKFSPDGRSLATAHKILENSQTNTFKVILWDVASGKEKLSLPAAKDEWQRVIDDLSFSSDGSLLASNLGGIARLWNVSNGTEVRRFPPPEDQPKLRTERVLLSPGGRKLAVYFKSYQPSVDFIRIWDLSNQKQIDLATNIYLDWAFSADSTLLAVTAIESKGQPDEHSAVETWDINSGERRRIIEVPKDWRSAFTVAFSPDISMIAIGGYKNFGIFSTQTGDLLASAQHARTRFFADSELMYELDDLEFSPDGNLLLTGGNDGTVKLWRFDK